MLVVEESLAGINDDCEFCHGEGFRRFPCTKEEMSAMGRSRYVYKRVPCAACFTQRLKERCG